MYGDIGAKVSLILIKCHTRSHSVDSDQLCRDSVPLDRHNPSGVWGRMREGVFPGFVTNFHRPDGTR